MIWMGKARGRLLTFGLVFSEIALLGCASSPSPEAMAPREDWLTQTGFYHRSSWPSARLHLTRGRITPARRLSDLFQGLKGIRFKPSSPEGFGIEEVGRDGDGTCPLHVYVNGRRLHRMPMGERTSVDEILPMHVIDGLEYHIAPDGPVYEEDGCGSLLLWSREMRTRQDRTLRTSIAGQVLSSRQDTVLRVELKPVGRHQAPRFDGEFSFPDLLPGEYELVFITESGPIASLKARAYAFRESRFELELGGGL
jgi:hypothetical protein